MKVSARRRSGYTYDVETDTGHVEPETVTFTANERPELWVDKSFVEAVVAGDADATLVCGLPAAEYAGDVGHRARLGHIPGSINLPVGKLLDRESNTLLPSEGLRQSLAPVLNDERIVAYCAGGVVSAVTALALTLSGHRNVAIYDGSLNEWASDANAPIVTGA